MDSHDIARPIRRNLGDMVRSELDRYGKSIPDPRQFPDTERRIYLDEAWPIFSA